MTDPVNTDALRTQQWQDVDELAEWAIAAADEVDRLRLSDWNATSQRDQLADALRRSDNENDRLRAVIENAPHAGDVGVCNRDRDGYSPHLVCTCWKAGAL